VAVASEASTISADPGGPGSLPAMAAQRAGFGQTCLQPRVSSPIVLPRAAEGTASSKAPTKSSTLAFLGAFSLSTPSSAVLRASTLQMLISQLVSFTS